MDITPTLLGATVDVTDVAVAAVVEMLAQAFADNETAVGDLLVSLAGAASALHNLKVSVAAGRDVSDERLERTACEVDGVRDALADMLSGRVTVQLTAAGCRGAGVVLMEAAQAAEDRWRTAGQVSTVKALLPAQQDRRAAA